MIMLIILSQFNLNLNQQPIVVKDEGTPQSTQRASIINCTGTGVTCSQSGSTMTISSTATAPGAPTDGGYVVWSSVGSSNERTLSAGNYTAIDTATPSQIQVDWAHGLTCSAGQAMTSGSTSTLACTSTITASDLACTGCVSSAEIVSVTGAQVSSAVATATALAGDPADCSANQYATAINASGTLTCAQPAFSAISGTVSDGQLASSYSGTGACGANTWASTLNDNASPTCTQPGFSNLSGAATITQGGTTETASTEDAVLVGASTTDWVPAVLPSCSNATTSKLLYNSSTNAFSCGTDQTGGAGGVSPMILTFGGF